MSESKGATPAFRVLFAVVAIASVAPLFCAKHLPMCDLPEHLATIATLRHWWDPAWRNQEYFSIAGASETPYWLYHAVGALLSVVTGSAERANLVLLGVVGVGYSYALRSLLRALGRDERLALFGAPLFWTQNLTTGLLNFVASVPLVMLGLALVVQNARAPRFRRSVALAVLSVAILYLHLSAFALFALGAVVVSVVFAQASDTPASVAADANEERRPRGVAVSSVVPLLLTLPRRLLWLVPAAVCALRVLSAGRAGASASASPSHVVFYMPRLHLLANSPAWLFDCFRSKVDNVLGWALIALFLGLLVDGLIGRTRRGATLTKPEVVNRRAARLLFAVATVMWFAMPSSVGSYVGLLDVRMFVFVALLAIPLVQVRPGRRGAAPLVFAGGLALLAAANVAHEVRAFDRDEMGNFDELLAKMPPGRRLLTLNFEPRSAHVTMAPFFGYFGSYYRARYGGVASFSFSEIPHWPVRYRAEARPPARPATGLSWGSPCVFRNSRDGAFYDFILVHGARDPIGAQPAGPVWELIGSSRAFHLYRRVAGEQDIAGEADDESLCL